MPPRLPEETRSLLLDTALAQFAENGFDGTSIRKIAEAAGLSLGLLYHYFPSKEALLQALFERSILLIQGCFMEVMAEPDPRQRLQQLLSVSFRVMREQRQFYRVSAVVRLQPKVLGALAEGIAAWNQVLQAQFADLLSEADIPEPETRALLLMVSLDGLCQHFVMAPETFPLEAVGNMLIQDLFSQKLQPQGAK